MVIIYAVTSYFIFERKFFLWKIIFNYLNMKNLVKFAYKFRYCKTLYI